MKSEEQDEWDPKPHERTWFSRRDNGERGWLVRREGADFIMVDSPMMPEEFRLRRYRQGDWLKDPGPRTIMVAQVAKIAFAADLELRRSLGKHGPPKSWEDMKDAERIEWLQGRGPEFGEDTPRQGLFRAIYSAIGGLAK